MIHKKTMLTNRIARNSNSLGDAVEVSTELADEGTNEGTSWGAAVLVGLGIAATAAAATAASQSMKRAIPDRPQEVTHSLGDAQWDTLKGAVGGIDAMVNDAKAMVNDAKATPAKENKN